MALFKILKIGNALPSQPTQPESLTQLVVGDIWRAVGRALCCQLSKVGALAISGLAQRGKKGCIFCGGRKKIVSPLFVQMRLVLCEDSSGSRFESRIVTRECVTSLRRCSLRVSKLSKKIFFKPSFSNFSRHFESD